MQRRVFLQRLSSFLLGGLFLSTRAIAKTNNEIKNNWHDILEYARWCPSVHNLQPHKVKIMNATEAEIYYDPKRLLPKGDVSSIFATVAIGIFIENSSIAANKHGQKIDIENVFNAIDNTKIKTTLFAKIKLLENSDNEEIDRELILQRRTSRKNYNGNALDQHVLNKIADESKKYGYDFQYSMQTDIINFLVEQNERTLFEDLESDEMRTELNALFRFSKQEAEERRDGLWSRCMGFPGVLMKSVFHHYQMYDKGILKKMISKFYKSSFKGTTTIGWIIGDFNNTNDWLQFGRLIARNWLLFTKHNAYIQPFGSLLTNEKAYQELCTKLNIEQGKKICMIFRVGYSKVPTKSYRLPLEEIIIK